MSRRLHSRAVGRVLLGLGLAAAHTCTKSQKKGGRPSGVPLFRALNML